MLHLIAKENKFPAKGDQKFEFPLKMEFGLILWSFEFYTSFLNSTFGFRIVLAHNYFLMTLIRISITRGVTPAPISTKAWSAIAFTDFRPWPLTLAECGARAAPVFHRALGPYFPVLAGGTGIRCSATTQAGTTHPPMGHCASALKNQTIRVNKCSKANVNIMKDIDPKIIP
jgi:hypothetical protein